MIHNISRFIAALALLATAQGAWADTETVSYIDADGNEQTVTATVLTGEETVNSYGKVQLAAGTYLVATDITYTQGIESGGSVNLILADGKTMTVGTEDDRVDGIRIPKLTIYGQTNGTGALSVYATGNAIRTAFLDIYGGNITANTNGNNAYALLSGNSGLIINRATVNATATGTGAYGIYALGNVAINGGTVTATAPNGTGICANNGNGDITLGGGTVTSYGGYYGTVAVALPDGYVYSDGSGNTYANGTLTDAQKSTIAGKTLNVAPDPAHFSVSGDEYTILTATGWGVFCDCLNDNDTYNRFSGKTVQLGADITVTRMAGGSNHAFTGTFDGGGHTLTLAYGTADAPVDAQFVAPFLETSNDGEHQPTFRNLTIAGSIYDGYTGSEAHNIGGLIGHLFGTVTIEHCTSLVEIHAKVGAGGFVGLCEHNVSFTDCHSAAVIRSADGSNSGFVAWSRASAYTIAFTGCLFDGKLLQQNGSGSLNGGFIGWTGATKTVTFTNCLCAPAPLATGETMASTGSATFARGWNATTKATNCYDTAAFDIAQGKATRTVAAAADVTIEAVALTGTATHYTVSGITAYSGGGLQRGQTLYYGSDDQLSLTLSAPQGYRYDGFTAYTASAGTLSGTTLTMPDENVTISVNTAAILSTGQPVTVAFIKADGTTQTEQAVALDGHEAVDEDGYVRLDAGTYYVGTDIAYANQIRPDGDITLILANGKTMTLNGNTKGIYGSLNLTIYGQSLDAATAGTLSYDGTADGITVNNYVQHSGNVSITTTGSWVWSIKANVTLRGGTLTISANGNNARAISGTMHSIFGGLLDATATGTGATGIYAFASSGTAITLGWTRPADRITASSISAPNGGTVAVKDGQALTDGSGHIYTGTLSASELSGFAAETTLQPCLALADAADNTAAITDLAGQTLAVALTGRTLYKDGSWNTLCLPFAVDLTASGPLSGDKVQAMTLNTTTSNFADGTLTLNFTAATETIPAGTPFIIKWDQPANYVAYNGQNAATCSDLVSPVFMGVAIDAENRDATVTGVLTFTGTYAPVTIDDDGDNTKLYLGAANKLYYPTKAMTIGTHRAYFQLLGDLTAGEPAGGIEQGKDQEDPVRAFVLNFGDDEASGIISVHDSGFMVNGSDAWYTLDGRRLDGQPTAKGLYIHGGKKVIVN